MQARIGQELDLLHVRYECIQDERIGFGASELADDHVAREIAQRGDASVAAVGGEEAHAAQARNAHGIEDMVVGDRVKEAVADVEGAGRPRQARNIEAEVGVAGRMTGLAADASGPGGLAEDVGRAEQHVAEGHCEGLLPAMRLGREDLARLRGAGFPEIGTGREQALPAEELLGVSVRRAGEQCAEQRRAGED